MHAMFRQRIDAPPDMKLFDIRGINLIITCGRPLKELDAAAVDFDVDPPRFRHPSRMHHVRELRDPVVTPRLQRGHAPTPPRGPPPGSSQLGTSGKSSHSLDRLHTVANT